MNTTKYAESLLAGTRHANEYLNGADFSLRNSRNPFGDLSNSDFRGAKLAGAVFDGSDLTCANFTDANLYGASFKKCSLYKANFTRAITHGCDFTDADIRGITITLHCDTFDGVKLPNKWLGCWLFFATLMDIDEGHKLKIEDIIGQQMVQQLKAARMAIQ